MHLQDSQKRVNPKSLTMLPPHSTALHTALGTEVIGVSAQGSGPWLAVSSGREKDRQRRQPAGLRLAGRPTPKQLLHGFTAKATDRICCGYPGRGPRSLASLPARRPPTLCADRSGPRPTEPSRTGPIGAEPRRARSGEDREEQSRAKRPLRDFAPALDTSRSATPSTHPRADGG
ncbi:hypothetical protein H8959_014023 [Pygathrix nigripes]